jgi:hypothetical protein
LHKHGLPEGSDKLHVSDIIELLIAALQAIEVADKELPLVTTPSFAAELLG